MELGVRSPLVDFFKRGEVAKDVRLLAARGALAARAHEQMALLGMGNVSEEVLRLIGMNRAWLKNYGVIAALVKNPKTPLERVLESGAAFQRQRPEDGRARSKSEEPLRLAMRKRIVSGQKSS